MRNSSYFPVSISRTFLALALPLSCVGLNMPRTLRINVSPTYPNKAVRIIVPFGPAGVADALPRIVGQKLSEKWGVPVVIDNKPGASGNIGMTAGIHAPADGYTLTWHRRAISP